MDRRKILLVDDEETSLNVLALALQGCGYGLLFARDGDEAIRTAMEHHPALILMDMNLPRTDGYHATQLIKANSDLKDIPVVAITARTTKFDEATVRGAGCDDYITKPYRVGDLRTKLARFLV